MCLFCSPLEKDGSGVFNMAVVTDPSVYPHYNMHFHNNIIKPDKVSEILTFY